MAGRQWNFIWVTSTKSACSCFNSLELAVIAVFHLQILAFVFSFQASSVGWPLAFHLCILGLIPGISMYEGCCCQLYHCVVVAFSSCSLICIRIFCTIRYLTLPPKFEHRDAAPLQAVVTVWVIMLVECVHICMLVCRGGPTQVHTRTLIH